MIETKNYSANVRCDGDQWFVNGKPAKILSSQAKRNAVVVRDNLQGPFSEHQTRLPFVEPLLVFVKHKHQLELNQPTIPVLKTEELATFICNYERQSRFARFSPELIQAIVDHLQHRQHTPRPAVYVAEPRPQANPGQL